MAYEFVGDKVSNEQLNTDASASRPSTTTHAVALLDRNPARIGIAYDPYVLDTLPQIPDIGPDGELVPAIYEPGPHKPYDKQGFVLPDLRDPAPAEPIDAMSIAPDPRKMHQLYIRMRERYKDGMSLALAEPKRPYADIEADYAKHCHDPDFSFDNFWDHNFHTAPGSDEELMLAAPGVTLDQYTLDIRSQFIRKKNDRSGFDIALPYDRSVAGADRFSRHSFQWDGYHMNIGHRVDGRWDLIQNTADNTENEILVYSHSLNGSAAFLATRPQIPYFSHEVSMMAEEYGDEALVRYLPAMEKEYKEYWMDGKEYLESLPDDGKIHGHRSLIRMPLGKGKFTYLNRYWDDADGPRLESYLEDVQLGERVAVGLTGKEREHRLNKLFKDVRAAAASGWDFSSRWFADGSTMETINTTDILPVDLNSLLARTEKMLSLAYQAKARVTGSKADLHKAFQYEANLHQRVTGINFYNYDRRNKIYRDFNFIDGHQTAIVSAAMAYPLYVGISNVEQSFGVAHAIEDELLFPGGVVATTTENSTQQWDGGKKDGKGKKNVWAPLNWAVARGLARSGHTLEITHPKMDKRYLIELAGRVKTRYSGGVQQAFDENHRVPEKIVGDNPQQMGDGGEYDPVRVLGMSSETWRAMRGWEPEDPAQCLQIGGVAVSASLT